MTKTSLSSRVPRGSPRTLWPSYQEQTDIMSGVCGEIDEAELRPSELMRKWDNDEYIAKHRGRLQEALILPEGEGDHYGPGHAPAGVYGSYGPVEPKRGQRVGDVIGATSSQLHVRTCAKNVEECAKYIDLGCDVNAVDTSHIYEDQLGWAPIHFAARWDRIDVIEMLLAHGADPLQLTWDGHNALVIARKRGHWAAYRLLESFLKTGNSSQHGVVSPHKQVSTFKDETDEDCQYLDQHYISPPKASQSHMASWGEYNDDGDPEMYEKPVRAPKHWEIDDDVDDEFDN